MAPTPHHAMISWDPALSIGIPAIDAQHEEIFARAAALEEALRSGASGAELGNLLSWLKRYAIDHFEAEERIMERVGYPGAAAHAVEHREFWRRLEMTGGLYEVEGDSEAMAWLLISLVRSWLVEHIGKSDQAIGAYIRLRGAPPPR